MKSISRKEKYWDITSLDVYQAYEWKKCWKVLYALTAGKKNTNEPVENAGKSESTWHSMNCGNKHFVTHPNICIEAHVMPKHLCPIWITSMTPVQMVTGCDHLISPVPINLPVNSSFDTLCLLFVQDISHDCRHFENNIRERRRAEGPFFPLKLQNIAPRIHSTRTFDPFLAAHESWVSPLDITPLKS